MYPTAMHTELATYHQRDLITAAAGHRLARAARQTRRGERRSAFPPVRRTSVRPATPPTQLKEKHMTTTEPARSTKPPWATSCTDSSATWPRRITP